MKSHTATPTTATMQANQQVELALNPRSIEPVLRSYLKQRTPDSALHQHPKNMACHVLDAKYEPGKRCSILYEVGDQLLIGELTWPTEPAHSSTKSAAVEPITALSTLQLYPVEEDPGLPTLATVTDGSAMAHIFNKHLPSCVDGQEKVVRCKATLLRYRLGKRCTLRYELYMRRQATGMFTKRTLFGKLYHSAEKAAAVYAEMHLLTAQNSSRQLTMATAVAYIPELPMVLQSPVADSEPLELLLQQPPSGSKTRLEMVIDGIRGAAIALAGVHESGVQTERTRPVDAELDKLARRMIRALTAGVDDAASGVATQDTIAILYELLQALQQGRIKLTAWGEECTVVHGDCKPSQFFCLSDTSTAILDFDHCGMADPAADVGNFLATLRQMEIKKRVKTQDSAHVDVWQQWLNTLEEAFLESYMASRSCPPAFRNRVRWYQAMALLRKAWRSYGRSTRSPLPALLATAAQQLLSR